jgi:ribonuclease HI
LRSFDPTLQTIDSNGVGTVTDFKERWQPPPAGMFKINCDVGFNPKLQCMGVGVIVRDEHGRVHAAQSKTLTSYQEPVVGEALAALQAVELSRDLGLQDILLEGDSLQVLTMILEQEDNWCRFG